MLKNVVILIATMFCAKGLMAQEWLIVLKADSIAIGIVTAVHNEKDGDLHIWLLMPDSTKLLAEVEHYSTSGYHRPKPGEIVCFSGAFVYDRKHHWYEIHPAINCPLLPE